MYGVVIELSTGGGDRFIRMGGSCVFFCRASNAVVQGSVDEDVIDTALVCNVACLYLGVAPCTQAPLGR